MAEDVIQARRIELLDEQGNPSLVLTARDEEGKAALTVSSVGEDAPRAMIGIDFEEGTPFLILQEAGGTGAHIFATILNGRAYIRLSDADGSQTDLSAD